MSKPKIYDVIATGTTEPRDIRDRFADTINVKDFGAVGDGTDETAKVQAALDYLNSVGGGELHFNDEVVRCDYPLIGYSNIKITGTPGSMIDWSHRAAPYNSVLDGGLLTFRGSASAEIMLTANAVYKTNKIRVPDASLFSEGDLVEVSMDAEGSFPDTSIVTKSGQFNTVVGVYSDTNTLVLDTVIFEALGYTTANGARIRKITPVENITIDGLAFKGVGRPATNDDGDIGVRVFHGRNVTVRNCQFDKLDSRALDVVGCYHFLIDNNSFRHDKMGDDNSKVSYSIAYSSSQYGTISNNKIVAPRHGVVSSHLSATLPNKYYGISRFVVIDGNHVTGNYGDVASSGWGMSHAGISTHTDAQFITIVNNTVSGCRYGINPRTFDITVANNTLQHNVVAGILLSGVFRDLLIQGNAICGGILSIANSAETEADAHPNLTIRGNVITNAGTVALTASAETISPGLDFSDNRISDYAGTATTGAVKFNGAFTGKIQNNSIDNALIPGMRLENTRGVLVTGNHIYRTKLPIAVLATCQKTVITGNTFINNTTIMSVFPTGQPVVSGNHDFGSGVL